LARARECLAVGALLWIAAAALQWKAGAFAVEFGSHPDEAAHYVTGLLIHDYILHGHLAPPLAYAERYYAHYPKVALGMWPPLFHCVEAVWMLLFSPAKASVLWLMSLITAVCGASFYAVLRRQGSRWAALAGGAVFVLAPLVQASTWAVMADGLVALLDLWAMICLVRYLESERTRDAVAFGIFAALSMATKANGVALVLLPLLALLLTRRFRLLRAPGLYYAAAIVLVFGVPWQVLSYKLIQRSMGVPQADWRVMLRTAIYYGQVLWDALGWGLAPFCVAGIAVFAVNWRRGRTDFLLAGALALLASVWIYHSSIGYGEPRYILGAVPAAVLFTVAGFEWTVRRVPRPAGALLGIVAGALFVVHAWAAPSKPSEGFVQPAHFLLTDPEFADGDFLVISNATGEGAFISEVAMHDARPGHIVLRASKVLASATWYGTLYRLRYKSVDEIRGFLDGAPVEAVLLDTRESLAREVDTVLASDANWRRRENFPWMELYSRVGPQPAGDIRLDLRYTLGKDIVVTERPRAGAGK
jgi:hypothetical protein